MSDASVFARPSLCVFVFTRAQCITEINTRMVVNTPTFIVKIADKDGVREIQLPGKPAAQ